MTWTTPDVQLAFNKAQPTYDSTATIQHRVANQLVEYLPKLPLTSVIDLGCGTGFVTDALLTKHKDSHFHLIDLSDQMIAGCREKYKNNDSITFATANMDEYIYPSADLIISNLAVQWSKDLRALLSNLTSKTSIVAFTTLTQGTFQEWEDLLCQNGITSPLLPMLSVQELNQICLNLNQDSRIYLQDYSLTFTSISDFIQYLRDLGATVGKRIQEKAKFKALIQHHKEPITVTYKVLFCVIASKDKPLS
ncbi:MAG: methyltransferase domain-containing protein [Candidatus Paracaedibacteraceae bacterium]|nr:methyltransferase domain-containing protein [Candidatus Paracaedibacteraceae bacterium]